MIDAMLLIDPACPFGHAAGPALTTLRWRYGEHLRWTIVMAPRVTEGPVAPALATQRLVALGDRTGMPVDATPRARSASSGRAARAFVAARTQQPELAWPTLRALQFAWSSSNALLDRDEAIAAALWCVDGLDAAGVLAALDHDDAVAAAVAIERTLPAAQTPTVVFTAARRRAGWWRAACSRSRPTRCAWRTSSPGLPRRERPRQPVQPLLAFPHGLATAELAALLAEPGAPPDRAGTRAELIELAAEGVVRRTPVGDDALWRLAEPVDARVAAPAWAKCAAHA